MQLKRIFGAIVLIFASATMSAAATLTIQLDNVISADGGEVSGTYDFDTAAGTFSNSNVVSTVGTNIPAATFNFVASFASPGRLAFVSSGAADLTGATLLDLGLTDSLANQSAVGDQIVSIFFGSLYICEDAGCGFPAAGPTVSVISGAQIPTNTVASVSTVPLPAGGTLLLISLSGFAGLRRWKKA